MGKEELTIEWMGSTMEISCSRCDIIDKCHNCLVVKFSF